MKIYTLLEPSKSLIKVITFPEAPNSDIELFFNNCYEKSVVLNKDIQRYIQFGIKIESLGKDLAMAIANDYPHLFIKPLEFPNTDKVFSHLKDEIKSLTESRLKKLDEQIARDPNVLKFRIDRADLFCNSGEYQRAKLEYSDILPLCAGNKYYKSKVESGLSTCELKLGEQSIIFQTPFIITEQANIIEQPQANSPSSTSSSFFQSSPGREEQKKPNYHLYHYEFGKFT